MTEPLHNDEALMRYIDGEMDAAEKAIFESQLQSDSVLKEKLEHLQVAVASVQQYGTAEKVRSIHTEMMQELSTVHKETKVVSMGKIIRYSLAVAASIIVILVGVNLFSSSQPSSQKLYNETFVDYDASAIRGGNEQSSQVAKLYQNHNYNGVIEDAGSAALSQRDSLLIGLSYLKTNKFSGAINWFKSISEQSAVKQDAEFYLSLAYLKNKNYNEALHLMEQIHSNSNHVYHDQFSDDYINKVRELSAE